MLVSELFENAATLIEAKGWIQETMRGPNQELCADGALWYAAYDGYGEHAFPDYERGRSMAYGLLMKRTNQKISLITYNDQPGRTKAEMLELFRWMADEARRAEA